MLLARNQAKRGSSWQAGRKSVTLSRPLIEEVRAVAPPGLHENLNRLVSYALREFAAARKAHAFEEAVSRMAADPAIQAECAAMSRDFSGV